MRLEAMLIHSIQKHSFQALLRQQQALRGTATHRAFLMSNTPPSNFSENYFMPHQPILIIEVSWASCSQEWIVF